MCVNRPRKQAAFLIKEGKEYLKGCRIFDNPKVPKPQRNLDQQDGMTMTTWKELLEEAMEDRGEELADLEANTLTEEDMEREFSDGYNTPFTAWTAKTVYFPLCYDGDEWVGSVSRNPDGKPTEHQGGG